MVKSIKQFHKSLKKKGGSNNPLLNNRERKKKSCCLGYKKKISFSNNNRGKGCIPCWGNTKSNNISKPLGKLSSNNRKNIRFINNFESEKEMVNYLATHFTNKGRSSNWSYNNSEIKKIIEEKYSNNQNKQKRIIESIKNRAKELNSYIVDLIIKKLNYVDKIEKQILILENNLSGLNEKNNEKKINQLQIKIREILDEIVDKISLLKPKDFRVLIDSLSLDEKEEMIKFLKEINNNNINYLLEDYSNYENQYNGINERINKAEKEKNKNLLISFHGPNVNKNGSYYQIAQLDGNQNITGWTNCKILGSTKSKSIFKKNSYNVTTFDPITGRSSGVLKGINSKYIRKKNE